MLGCDRDEQKIGTMTIVDSLGWQEDSEMTNVISDFEIRDDKLYMMDSGLSKIFVYDVNDFSLISSFGEKGKGPGEFEEGYSFSFDNDGNLVVCDWEVLRITWFNQEGEYLKSLNSHFPTKTLVDEENFYILNIFALPEYGLYKLQDEQQELILDLASILEEAGHERMNREGDIMLVDNKVFISLLHTYPNLYVYENSELKQLSTTIDEIGNFEECGSGDFIKGEDCFYILQYMFEDHGNDLDIKNSSSKELKDSAGITEYLCQYNYDGELQKRWKVPEDFFAREIRGAIKDNYIILQDFGSLVIYKLKLEDI